MYVIPKWNHRIAVILNGWIVETARDLTEEEEKGKTKSPFQLRYSSDQISGNVSVWLLCCCCYYINTWKWFNLLLSNRHFVPDTYCVVRKKSQQKKYSLYPPQSSWCTIENWWCMMLTPEKTLYRSFFSFYIDLQAAHTEKSPCTCVCMCDYTILFVRFYSFYSISFLFIYFHSVSVSYMHACTQYAIEFDCVREYINVYGVCMRMYNVMCSTLIDGGSLFTLRSLYHTPGFLSIYCHNCVIYIAHIVQTHTGTEGGREATKKVE